MEKILSVGFAKTHFQCYHWIALLDGFAKQSGSCRAVFTFGLIFSPLYAPHAIIRPTNMKTLLSIVIASFCVLFVLHWLSSPIPDDSGSDSSSSHSSNSTGAKATAPSVQEWHVSLATRVLDSDRVSTSYAWKLTITNESSQASGFKGELQFFDADGFLVDRHPLYDSSQPETEYTMRNGYFEGTQFRLLVPAKSQAVFTGTVEVRAVLAEKVARIAPQINKETYDEQPQN
jgi:hypothetical protein